MIGAPTSGPAIVPAPPKITVVRKKIEVSNSNASGLMKPWKKANRCPPAPARPALMVKATVFTPRVLRPTACAAIGFSRTATKARPHGERMRLRSNRVVTAAAATISRNWLSSVSRLPAMVGLGMLRTPCVPPVSSDHSIRMLLTMMPKAMVTIAR